MLCNGEYLGAFNLECDITLLKSMKYHPGSHVHEFERNVTLFSFALLLSTLWLYIFDQRDNYKIEN